MEEVSHEGAFLEAGPSLSPFRDFFLCFLSAMMGAFLLNHTLPDMIDTSDVVSPNKHSVPSSCSWVIRIQR